MKHSWTGYTGCRCHVTCSQCGAQARKNEPAFAKPCTQEARDKWAAKNDAAREARFKNAEGR